MIYLKYFFIIVFFFNLLSCAHQNTPTEGLPFSTQTHLDHSSKKSDSLPLNFSSAERIHSWDLVAVIGIQKAQETASARLVWHQKQREEYQIRFIGPLGNIIALIEARNQNIAYHDDKHHLQGKEAHDAFFKETGIKLPIDSFYYWIRGLPAPLNIEAATRTSDGRLISLNQEGYQLKFSDYIEMQGSALPTKIELKKADLNIKIKVKKWHLGS